MSEEKKELDFSWASNPTKLKRAIAEVEEAGKEVTEAGVKKVYKRMLGHIKGDLARGAAPEAADMNNQLKTAYNKGFEEGVASVTEEKSAPTGSAEQNPATTQSGPAPTGPALTGSAPTGSAPDVKEGEGGQGK